MKATIFFLIIGFVFGCKAPALSQTRGNVNASTIRSVKLYKPGDQTSFPALLLNSQDVLQLDFDDLTTSVRNYYYTYQLCNADWSPSMLQPFEYLKGFQTNRITTYRNSSLSTTRYVHYQATIPERNSYPSRSGNYLLKVFLDNDTSKVVFTRKFIVYNNQANVAAQVQQPFNATLFRSGQKLQIAVQTDNRIQALGPNDLKVVVLQNNNWQTALYMDRPTLFRGNYYEYSDEAITGMLAGKEFRWVDLRSLRLMSDRMENIRNTRDSVNVVLKTDVPRSGQSYIFYRDLNGSYTIESMESINPFWQGDYAYVHFRYAPPGKRPIQGSDVYIFGEMTNYAADTSGKMNFNSETGLYEKTLFLKQGFYNYLYATKDSDGGPVDFSQTEGNHWSTENSYVVLVYYRPFGSRADEVIGFSSINSIFQRQGL